MMPTAATKLKLPVLRRVALRNFSLFAANPNAEFDCPEGVLCLVGANGIGKSTLLSAINFCLTGIVSDPQRAFESMGEFYKFTREYSATYFRGRISGTDEDDAEVLLRFSVGQSAYEVRRGLFEPDELRSLSIADGESGTSTPTEGLSRRERHALYADSLTRNIGLASFEEFVFLQHFVFTFDEQRRTLFWSPRVMERVLYRAFGFDPSMAKRADGFRREIQHEDSKVRNRQWEATRMRKRINEIRAKASLAAGAQKTFDSLSSDHEQLTSEFEENSRALKEAEDALRDANLQLAEQSVRETSLRDEYASLFDRRFDQRPPLAKHPLIVQSLTSRQCGICGSSESHALGVIEQKASIPRCPLCDTALKQIQHSSEDVRRLEAIDKELAQVRRAINNISRTVESLKKVVSQCRSTWQQTKDKLDAFDRENSETLDSLRKLLSGTIGEASLKDYREQLGVIDSEKRDAYARREQLKSDLLKLQRNLEEQYLTVEQHFVPQFSNLAQQFLGMPLKVEMDARSLENVNLVVSVRGTTRRLQQHLSESQRFFLDIALRMALTQHMSDPTSQGGMFIDTPEGSLDIAYEKRAGDMLAMFASAGHQIVMTANLNSSQLLLALAHRCGPTGMQFLRMTDWAELSEVQQQEEQLFDTAYNAIEQAMEENAGHGTA